jgi:hypothetical protein
MAATETASRAGVYLERLLDNNYAQEQLGEAVEKLRAAYARASKRRVQPARDEKLRRQVRDATLSLSEAAKALKTGRKKPERRKGRRALMVVGIGAVGAAAALAASEDLRKKLFAGESPADQAGDGDHAAAPAEGTSA